MNSESFQLEECLHRTFRWVVWPKWELQLVNTQGSSGGIVLVHILGGLEIFVAQVALLIVASCFLVDKWVNLEESEMRYPVLRKLVLLTWSCLSRPRTGSFRKFQYVCRQ